MNNFVFQGMKRDTALVITGVSKHQYYHKSQPGKRGRKPSRVTSKIADDGMIQVLNTEVVQQVKVIQSDPDTDYGYHKMTFSLLILGYLINHKKVYRLMRESYLLKDRHKKAPRQFAIYRKVLPTRPLEVLEMDIKYVWVEEYRRHAFIFTVIDTFTRVILYWQSAYQFKQGQVKRAWEYIIENYLQPFDCLYERIHIEVRNDNDSRFAAKTVQQFFAENKLNQVFTHPYTPQENGHIESFHAILSQMLSRHSFWSIEQLDNCLAPFYEKYNHQRLHSSTAFLPPMVFWKCWQEGLIDTKINEKCRTIKFKLKIPYPQLSGIMIQRAVPCSQPTTLDGLEDVIVQNEMTGADSFLQPSVY
ncbi:MAG: DDE-type integrase/transposase/recombinase [Bacteroidales bacterium]|nr:DDE-type integrase/transposase/recombinase [Bacteroidales bacterium]